MTTQQHARVKELFHKARELSPENREEFLSQECGEDDTLRHEVTSLLSYDRTATILARPSSPPVDAPAQIGRPNVRLLSRVERAVSQVLQQILGHPGNRLLVIGIALLLLVGLAMWMYTGMKQATQSIAASELRTILNADIKALELWIEEKKEDVRLWSSRPEIRQAVNDLTYIAETERKPREKLLSSSSLAGLRDLFEEFDRTAGHPERDAVVTRDGLVVAADRDDVVGMRLNTDGIAALVPVFQGETLFFKPHPYGAFGMDRVRDLDNPVVLVVSPIRRGDPAGGEIIAAAGFGFPADDEFTDILSVARLGRTGETYTFDEDGLLLSESRFDEELRTNGLLPDDPGSRSIFRIEVRDPGTEAGKPLASSVEAARRPLTRLAAEAIAAGRKGHESEQEGVILEAYRNYRGARVIGAWKWLPKYSFGAATEVEVDEQYAPMRYPLIAEWIRFGLLVSCALGLLAAACWIAVLRRDVEEALQLGQYTLEEKIGEGGMGVVYRARHALLQRPTAIKLLRPEMINVDAVTRFEREVQLASGLTHPNTIDIFDFGLTPEGSFYCVMEFLNGQTLEEVVSSKGPLAADRVINILEQTAGSLNEAHNHGLVHRDIKPSNIMLCEQGGIPDFIKVLDFGIARPVERSDGEDVTQAGLVVGTPTYLAPERITDPSIVDQRSDVYSLGAVGYFLLTSLQIYDAPRAVDIVHQILNEVPRRPSEVTSKEIPRELEEFIVRCLVRSPQDRPATMQEVITNITRIRASLAKNNTDRN